MIVPLCNGSTPDSGSVSEGSNPSGTTNNRGEVLKSASPFSFYISSRLSIKLSYSGIVYYISTVLLGSSMCATILNIDVLNYILGIPLGL